MTVVICMEYGSTKSYIRTVPGFDVCSELGLELRYRVH